MNIKETKKRGKFRRFGALVLALTMIFGSLTPAIAVAAPTPTAVEEHVEKPEATPAEEAQADGLEISPEEVPEAVGQGEVPAPIINKVFYGATSVSGKNLYKKRINKTIVIATVHVTVKDQGGNVKATLSVTPKSGKDWNVKLPEGVEIAEGDTVTAYQVWNNIQSPEASANAELSMAGKNKDKLKMPTGEIWIEQTSSNQVNKDEQKEAVEMLKAVNPTIANDFDKIVFSIKGTEHAYYEVTYKDGSKSEPVEAPNLKIRKVTEKSAAPTIQKVQITDGQIVVTFEKDVPTGTKFTFVSNFTDGADKNFCAGGNCDPDKSTKVDKSHEVTIKGKTVTFPINNNDLELGKEFGVIVKEPHKFRSCAKSKPVVTAPAKVAVRDPHKLTDDDKTAIDQAIRKANIRDGKSKLPDGTGGHEGIPAPIVFNEDGSVSIFSGNDVEVKKWDDDRKPIPEKNSDGTNKLQDGAKPFATILAKDLVKNIAPKSPSIAVDTDTGKVTVTPPAYENHGEDTDLLQYTLTYQDENKAPKEIVVERDLVKDTWSIIKGDKTDISLREHTGQLTLDVNKLKVGGTLTATAKDNGDFESGENKLKSDPATQTLETAKVTYKPGEYKPSDDADPIPGTVDDQNPMKDDEVNKGGKFKLAKKCNFKAPEDTTFAGWKIGNEEYLVKSTDEDGNHTYYKKGDANQTPVTELQIKEDTEVTALWNPVFTVTFNVKGHGTAPDAQKVAKDGTATKPTAPTDKGWTFGGWFTDEKLTSEYDFTTAVTKSFTLYAKWTQDNPGGSTGGDDNPGTTPGTKPGDNTPGTNPNDPNNPNNPNKPDDSNNPNKPNDPNAPGQPSDPKGPKGPNDPSAPWGKGNTDIDALLRRMKALRNDPAVRKILEGQRVIPRAGVGASTTAVEPMLFPVDLLPAPKKREEE